MRMTHYYLGLALLLAPALLATLATGAFYSGTQLHLNLGLVTAIGCVAQNTLLILFMIVTGRVLKQAVAARSLPPEFLAELNEFFARRLAYPVALVSSTCAVIAAVLGYGSFIGVSTWVHMLFGLATVITNLAAIEFGRQSLRANQELLDRAAATLDQLDARSDPEDPVDPEESWAYSLRMRWAIFAGCAWFPYMYWGAIVWHGDFARISTAFLLGTAVVSGLGVLFALGAGAEVEEG